MSQWEVSKSELRFYPIKKHFLILHPAYALNLRTHHPTNFINIVSILGQTLHPPIVQM